MRFEILGGRSFLDQLFDSEMFTEQKSSFILHISFKKQRFYTKSVSCTCEPKFGDTFMMDFAYFEGI